MPRNREKDYTVRNSGNELVKINDYRQPPWRQTYAGITTDFRRWFYVRRPELTENGNYLPKKNGHTELLINAGRDIMVENYCYAVYHIPSVEDKTKNSYCLGLKNWFEFLDYRIAAGHPVYDLADINKEVITGFIRWLRYTKEAKTDTGRLSFITAKTNYTQVKAVLLNMVRRGALSDDGMFPRNPFPHSNQSAIGHDPFAKNEMTALMAGLYSEIKAVREGKLQLAGSDVLALHLLAIAARTGRNTMPLLELTRDAVMPHPIKPDKMGLLVTYKRRGRSTSVQAFDKTPDIEDMISLPMDALTLYNDVLKMTAPLVAEVKSGGRDRLWIFRKSGCKKGQVGVLSELLVKDAAQKLVDRLGLTEGMKPLDEGGKRLILNISRLRKTFGQRIWQLTGGDLAATADALGNTPPVADRSYIAVAPEMVANFRRVGIIMHADWGGKLDDLVFLEKLAKETDIPVSNLRDIAVGYNNTGVGRCTDPKNGVKAPGDGALCTRWLECFSCPNQLVLESDLHRLFSFYFLLIKERNFISRKRWDELYGPIIQIIDQEIIAANLKTKTNQKGCFDPYRVNRAKAEAETNPHPMWRDRSLLGSVS